MWIERRGFVALALAHAPAPHELQFLRVGRRDLRERAVAPPLIVSPRHQPVARILIAQHLVGDRRVVLHCPCDGDAERSCIRRCAAASTARRLARAGRCALTSSRCASTSGSGWCRARAGRRRACGDAADGSRGCRRQRRGARLRAVRLQDVCGHREELRLRQALSGRRHRRLDELEEILCRLVAPRVHEIVAGQLRRLVASGEVRHVAAGAARRVDRASRGRLLRSEDRPGRLLASHERDSQRHRGEDRGPRQWRTPHRRFSCGRSQPHKLPSGAFSL